jgi:hypothetical protein
MATPSHGTGGMETMVVMLQTAERREQLLRAEAERRDQQLN